MTDVREFLIDMMKMIDHTFSTLSVRDTKRAGVILTEMADQAMHGADHGYPFMTLRLSGVAQALLDEYDLAPSPLSGREGARS